MSLIRIVLCAALLSGTAAGPAFAAAGSCATPEQVKAAQLRQFHYQLQVAALNCRDDDPSLPGKWQSYIQRHSATLADNAKVMQGYFKSAAAFDRHNTLLTNRESVFVHEAHGYCELRAPMFDKALTLTGAQLASYAAETVGPPDNIRPCREAAKAAEKKSTRKKAE